MDRLKPMYEEKWIEEYRFLEDLRQSGIVDMQSIKVREILRDNFDISIKVSVLIHLSFLQDYKQLVEDGIIKGDKSWGNQYV